ncbi:adenosine deaminase [Treponema sp.]|uniref:adenosine deaminase n=1 Tax=Treponema sp. TaxID=166 RepID=UPI0025E0EDAC|nr:adenosine deaminase [Treponema sp.]MCR5217311.1 adenosine deaminase [Treponema sp.]
MKKSDFYSLLTALPKAELHIHEEAVLSRSTIKKVYKRSFNKDITSEEYDQLFAYTDLAGFLDSFIKIQKFFTNVEDMELLFKDFSDYLEKNNIVYCETFISPTSHLKKGWDFSKMISLISKSISKIKKEKGRTVKIIIDVSRSFGLENAMNNLDLVLKENSPDIIGIGLGGNEATGPAKDYEKVFVKAKEKGLHVVAHAGEICESWSMKDSINLLKAERIGHGITAINDSDFLKELAENKICLEVCPTSNVFTNTIVKSFDQHPVKKLYDAGVNVTINTDDPTFFKVSLIDEYWNVYKELGFTLKEIKDLVKNSFRNSFISDSAKKKYCSSVDKAWKEWFQDHPDAKEE